MTLNPRDVFDKLRQADLDPSIFDQVDDRDFAKAPNFLEWAIGPKFLSTSILPKQIEIGSKLFAEYCPDCSRPGYIDILFDQSIGQIKDNVVFLEHGVCPKCKQNRFDLIEDGKLIPRHELVAAVGQRAGKSTLVAMLATYINHRFLKVPNINRSYNQASGITHLGTFSALTLEQATNNLWEPFRGFMSNSPWFQQYHAFLRDQEKKNSTELLHELKTSVHYIHKRLKWAATGSQDRKMRGPTRIWASIDELGWMISDETKPDLQNQNADAVYTALSNSLTTMRRKYSGIFSEENFDMPPIVMANISSPSSSKDKIMRLVRDAVSNKKILAVHCPTWEANPDYDYSSLREEYAHLDEAVFMRDFGAEPPLAANPFLSEPSLVDKIAVGDKFDAFHVSHIRNPDQGGGFYLSSKLVIKKLGNTG